ncbi:hypothetical protein A3H65_01450 [Candidatus Giovannonibacteria bacterium RIFCSPLOWO2_02_FULL_45_14]|nr:MAG: hypothetical protein A3H65_01450 [Candidatus Giovannonibacteria bacterium RIFCSPLOWO2_02_FULL_45_14]
MSPDDNTLAVLVAKPDITAGDGAKHDIIQGKEQIATSTTCNIFKMLKSCGVSVAFREQLDEKTFSAEYCEMLPYEVVIRREAHGSYSKRFPFLCRGHVFPKLVLEFFLKTSGRVWQGNTLPKDDPLIEFVIGGINLQRPDIPSWDSQSHVLHIEKYPLCDQPKTFTAMGEIAREAYLILEKAWQLVGRKLVDYKVEFGLDHNGILRLADVIDNDSWRVVEDGQYIDKQAYRDGEDLNEVTEKYRHVQRLTELFSLPRQRIIFWRGSDKDDFSLLKEVFGKYVGFAREVDFVEITCSAHRKPAHAYQELAQVVQKVPDAVVIAYVGRSNGLGPTLSGNTSVPVISLPNGWREFPNDVWSSLRTPNEVPASTILEPQNAVLHALQILALRNPRLYAKIRIEQEKRAMNFFELR